MERIVFQKLIEWKDSVNRKPLILNGARQVGKTWLLEQLGEKQWAREMRSNGEENIFYHKADDGTRLEIDFMIQRDGKLLPIEVKAEGNVRANSLSNLLKQKPELHAIRYSMKPYIEQEQMTCYPLYAIQ